MSDTHATDAPGHANAAAGDHHDLSDHGDDHGHDEEALGPIDFWAWGAGILGLAVALGVAACFALATGTLV